MFCPNCGREFKNIKVFPVHCSCGNKVGGSGEQVKPPSLKDKVKNFSKALTNHAKNGFKKVPEEVSKKRHEICKQCPLYDSSRDSCNKCGCNMSFKTTWAGEKCPIDKWGRYEEDTNIQ